MLDASKRFVGVDVADRLSILAGTVLVFAAPPSVIWGGVDKSLTQRWKGDIAGNIIDDGEGGGHLRRHALYYRL